MPGREFRDRPRADGRPLVGKELGQLFRCAFLPGDIETARIVDPGRALAADSVNRPQDIGLPKLRRGAAQFVPAARVDHDQAAVGILDHVGRVKIEAIGNEEVTGRGSERRGVRSQNCPRHLADVETTGEQVVPEIAAENVRFVSDKTAGGRRPEMHQRRHQLTCQLVTGNHSVRFTVNAAVNRVNQAVVLPISRVHQKRRGEDAFATRREDDFNGIVHTARHDRFDSGSVRRARKM